ncbi:hypothetical protein KY331_03150 [Candidatus Woesearchaeota archaeon]|nr:hypothetical protein [Candidatus Woesearchaeota archaeon]
MGKEYVKELLDKLEEETRKTERKQTLEEVLDLIDKELDKNIGSFHEFINNIRKEIKKLEGE